MTYYAATSAFGVGGAVLAGVAFSTLSVTMCALAGAIITGVGILFARFCRNEIDPIDPLSIGLAGAVIAGPLACRVLLALPLSSGFLLAKGVVASVFVQNFVIPMILEMFSHAPSLNASSAS